MLIELAQMSMAVCLLAIGVWLYSLTKPAQPHKIIRLSTPVWVRWASNLATFVTVLAGKRRQIPS